MSRTELAIHISRWTSSINPIFPEAETELANQMDKLNEKRAQLQQVTDKLQGKYN